MVNYSNASLQGRDKYQTSQVTIGYNQNIFRNSKTLENHIRRQHRKREKICIKNPISEACKKEKINKNESHMTTMHEEKFYERVETHPIECQVSYRIGTI